MKIEEVVDSIMFDDIFDDYDSIIDDNLSLIGTMVNLGRDEANAVIQKAQIAMYSAIMDNRTCPLCADLDGLYAKVGSDEYYEYTPPLHGRCRCIWVYIGDESTMPSINFRPPSDDLIKAHGHLVGKNIIIKDVAQQTKNVPENELNKMAKDFFNSLSKEEQDAILNYTGPISYPMNEYLRTGKISSFNMATFTKQDVFSAMNKMKKIFEKAKATEREIEVYRYAKSDMFKNKSIESMVGKTFKDKGFMSTTTKGDFEQSLSPGANVFFKIKVPKGNKVVPIGDKSVEYGNQRELVLDRGAKVKINKVTYNKAPEKKTIANSRQASKEKWDMYIVECEVIS
ncbi:MAG: ADP-ribosyltransferase [Acidithiobacillus sp.]|jgi:hypothetical protein|uniref:ADP-ribosyltransferase n=1 Tax=Acidithiobacillus sp. TaxID=1872118 RepID=UPI00355DC7C3